VIIPCFRCADTVERAVASAAGQTSPPKEILLVEDCSADAGRTLDSLYRLQQKYQGKVSISIVPLKNNNGPGGARNAGWDAASQPYIAFLDADDAWHPEKLSIQYECMRNEPDIALCGHQCIWLREGESMPVVAKDLLTTRVSARSLLFKNSILTSTAMLRRDVSFRFQKGKRYIEDLLLWQQIAFSGLQVARIEGPLAYVHKPFYGAGGLSAQLWKMEQGELDNLHVLRRQKNIGWLLFLTAFSFSTAKFIRRLVVSRLRRVAKPVFNRGVQ